jgi:ribosomal-protein-alanine N-acetyltransferase
VGDHRFDHAELLTARLSLRRPETGDADAILTVHADPRAVAHNPGDALATRAEAAALCQRWTDHWERHGFGYWVVRRRGSPPVLGFCGLKVMRFRDTAVLNLFYRLAPSSWGDGIASEAVTAVVAWAAGHVPQYPLIARVRPRNIASQRVAVRAGLMRAAHLDGPGLDGDDWIFLAPPAAAG